MPSRRPDSYPSAELQVRARMRLEFKLGRVNRAIEWMDKHVGYGWKRRMQKVDHVFNQNFPRNWQVGRRVPSWASLRKFEEYCARFGYDMPDQYLPHVNVKARTPQVDVREALDQFSESNESLLNYSSIPA